MKKRVTETALMCVFIICSCSSPPGGAIDGLDDASRSFAVASDLEVYEAVIRHQVDEVAALTKPDRPVCFVMVRATSNDPSTDPSQELMNRLTGLPLSVLPFSRNAHEGNRIFDRITHAAGVCLFVDGVVEQTGSTVAFRAAIAFPDRAIIATYNLTRKGGKWEVTSQRRRSVDPVRKKAAELLRPQ